MPSRSSLYQVLFLVVFLTFGTITGLSADTAAQRAVHEFLGHIKAENYAEAASRFSEELRFECSEQRLREFFADTKRQRNFYSGDAGSPG